MTTTKLHYHCGFDCYRRHRNGLARCSHVGHYDHGGYEPCLEDCRDRCRAKRTALKAPGL